MPGESSRNMTPSFLISPTGTRPHKRTGFKELAMFGLRKAFIDPAPRPKKHHGNKMDGFFGNDAMGHWLPE